MSTKNTISENNQYAQIQSLELQYDAFAIFKGTKVIYVI